MPASKTRRPAAVGSDEKVLMALVRAAELFKRRSARIFSQHGLSFSQYNTLRVLEASPGGSQCINRICQELLVSSPNLSGIAKRLANSGFVRRGRDKDDERRTVLVITPKGRRVLAAISRQQEDNIAEFLASWPDAKKRRLLGELKQMLGLQG